MSGDGKEIVLVTETSQWGGTERVVQTLADRFPAARIVAPRFANPAYQEQPPPWTARARLIPCGQYKRHFLAPLYARRMASAQLGPARLVLSFPHSGWAHAAVGPPGARHICYSNGPPPALYARVDHYLRNYPLALRPALRAAIPALRADERRLMRRPHRLVTISAASAAALERVHGRRAQVVHPPVRTDFFTPAPAPKRHLLAVSRLVPQKRLEVLVGALRDLDETLVVAGTGPWLDRLRALAPPNVHFTGWVSDGALRDLYRTARALVCPSVEDFGIVMAEAHACGVPVIAPRAGGALEIVDRPGTGVLLPKVDARSLAGAVTALRDGFVDPVACRASAERFAEDRFVARTEEIVDEELALAGGRQPLPAPPDTEPVTG